MHKTSIEINPKPFLRHYDPDFSSYTERTQAFLMHWVGASLQQRSVPVIKGRKGIEIGHTQFAKHFTERRYIERRDRYFYKVEAHENRNGAERCCTWWIADDVREAFVAFQMATGQCDLEQVSRDGKKVSRRAVTRLCRSVSFKVNSPQFGRFRFSIPKGVRVNGPAMDEMLEAILLVLEGKADPSILSPLGIPKKTLHDKPRLIRIAETLYYQLLALTCSSSQGNLLPHVYSKGNTGRLYGRGILHLQRAPREVRRCALSGMGLCYLDFEAAQPTILYNLCLSSNPSDSVDLKHLHQYITRKKEMRQILADYCAIDKETIKAAINAMTFGSSLRWSAKPLESGVVIRKGLAELFPNKESFKMFMNHPFIIDLNKDLDEGREWIMRNMKRTTRDRKTLHYYNVINERIDTNNADDSFIRKAVAHCLQGWESMLLHFCVEYIQDNFNARCILLIHDGWILDKTLEPKDIIILRSAMNSKFGFDLGIEPESLR